MESSVKASALKIELPDPYRCVFEGVCLLLEQRIRDREMEGLEDALREYGYVKERTCKRVVKTNERPGKTVFNQWYACSKCGCPLNPNDKYCPNCGARVVGD